MAKKKIKLKELSHAVMDCVRDQKLSMTETIEQLDNIRFTVATMRVLYSPEGKSFLKEAEAICERAMASRKKRSKSKKK